MGDTEVPIEELIGGKVIATSESKAVVLTVERDGDRFDLWVEGYESCVYATKRDRDA